MIPRWAIWVAIGGGLLWALRRSASQEKTPAGDVAGKLGGNPSSTPVTWEPTTDRSTSMYAMRLAAGPDRETAAIVLFDHQVENWDRAIVNTSGDALILRFPQLSDHQAEDLAASLALDSRVTQCIRIDPTDAAGLGL